MALQAATRRLARRAQRAPARRRRACAGDDAASPASYYAVKLQVDSLGDSFWPVPLVN